MLVEELNPLQRLLEAQKRTSGGGSDGVFALEAGGGGGGGSKHDGECCSIVCVAHESSIFCSGVLAYLLFDDEQG